MQSVEHGVHLEIELAAKPTLNRPPTHRTIGLRLPAVRRRPAHGRTAVAPKYRQNVVFFAAALAVAALVGYPPRLSPSGKAVAHFGPAGPRLPPKSTAQPVTGSGPRP
ncbi:MAG: hypothetical protein ACRDQA_23360 [Nocardioidaceae bacterium]